MELIKYEPGPNYQSILDRFKIKVETPEQSLRMVDLETNFILVAQIVLALAPPGPEQALALTHLEEALLWTQKAILTEEQKST